LNKIILFLLTLFISQITIAQKQQEKIAEINKKCNSITTDRLGNLYLINDYKITMYNRQGDSLREFNSRKFGNISFVDATDPYKIMVFFKNYNLFIFLDNYLSQNGDEIDLQDYGYDQISFACQSRIKGVWVFDQLKQKLIKLDENYNQILESINLAQWFGKNLEPCFMVENNNQLYLNDLNNGVFVFDHYGTFLKKINLKGPTLLQILGNNIKYNLVNKYCQYGINSFETNCIELDSISISQIRIEKNRAYYKSSNITSIFSTN
jgi:hypothetical protein